MTLKDCTKEELIYIINYLSNYGLMNTDFYIERALNEVEYKRERKKLDKADEWAKIAHDARMKYCDLLEQYEGVPILDIPREIIKEAQQLIKTAQDADEKYCKLIGIE